MLAQLEKEYEGELKVEYIDVATLPYEESSVISSVPMYKLLSSEGAVIEIWSGTKSKDRIVDIIENALDS